MSIKIIVTAITIGALSLSSLLYAANAKPSTESKSAISTGAELIGALTNHQVIISQTFETKVGLTGYVIEPAKQGGKKQVVFTQGDQYLIIGNVMTKEGQNITDSYTQKYITSKVAKESYQEISNLNWVSEGSDDAKHKMYVIIDPNCVYCHHFYKEVNKLNLIKDKQLQIRWLPVGFLKPTSAGMAAAMLHAKSPIQAIVKDENAAISAKGLSDIKPLDKASTNPQVQADFQKITANTEFFSKYNFGGTPTLIYQKMNDGYGYTPGFVKGPQLMVLIESLSSHW